MKARPIYMDYNATTPCDPRVVESMLPFFTEHPGNAASADHAYGWEAREAVEEAREQVAGLIGATAGQLYFTSGATEAVNLALKGVAEARGGGHIITCKTEHKAVLDTCAYLETKGYQVTYLDTDSQGAMSLSQLEAAITGNTICIALMYANNETGVIHPVKAIGDMARKYQVPFFCDATQAAGKIPVNVQTDGISLMAFSAHKIYGPKGVGALFVNKRQLLLPQQHGGSHERGVRSGTLNTTGIIGFGKAAALCAAELHNAPQRLAALRDRLETMLLQQLPGTAVNGGQPRLPHVSNLLLPHPDAEQLLLSLSAVLAISRGSACAGVVQQPSHVLKAMGLSDVQANSAIRISLGRFTTEQDIITAAHHLTNAVLSAAAAL